MLTLAAIVVPDFICNILGVVLVLWGIYAAMGIIGAVLMAVSLFLTDSPPKKSVKKYGQ